MLARSLKGFRNGKKLLRDIYRERSELKQCDKKRRERKSLVKAVLKAQEKHKLEGIIDPTYIAELSRSITKVSTEEAYLRANEETQIDATTKEDTGDQDFVEIII